jgi:hypothetical protein
MRHVKIGSCNMKMCPQHASAAIAGKMASQVLRQQQTRERVSKVSSGSCICDVPKFQAAVTTKSCSLTSCDYISQPSCERKKLNLAWEVKLEFSLL